MEGSFQPLHRCGFIDIVSNLIVLGNIYILRVPSSLFANCFPLLFRLHFNKQTLLVGISGLQSMGVRFCHLGTVAFRNFYLLIEGKKSQSGSIKVPSERSSGKCQTQKFVIC